jgi:hypothetical protein
MWRNFLYLSTSFFLVAVFLAYHQGAWLSVVFLALAIFLAITVKKCFGKCSRPLFFDKSGLRARGGFCLSLKAKKKTAGKVPSRFLAPQRRYSAHMLHPPQVGRLKVLIFKRAGARFTAELVVEKTQCPKQVFFI